MVCDSDTLWKSVGNEVDRLANGIDNRLSATNAIELIRRVELPKSCTSTCTNFVCEYCPLKSEPYRVRLTLGRNIIEYPDDASFPEASLLESKTTF